MGKVGRNAQCPCGSGRKYKKCCLDKDEAAASVKIPRPATPDPQVGPSVYAALREIHGAAHELAYSIDNDYLWDLCEERGYISPADARRRGYDMRPLALYAAMGGEVGFCTQHRLRDEMRKAISTPAAREVYENLLATPLGAWRCTVLPRGDGEVRALAGRDRTPKHVENVFSVCGGIGAAGLSCLGWYFERGGLPFLFAIAAVPPGAGIGEVVAQHSSAGSDAALWKRAAWDVLDAVLNPNGELDQDEDEQDEDEPHRWYGAIPSGRGQGSHGASSTVHQTWCMQSASAIIGHTLSSPMPEAPQTTIQGRRVRPGFFRELLAVAETKEQVEQFVGLAAAVRQVQVERAERTWKLGGWLSEQLPMERILRAFGVRVDGSIHGLDEEELLRRPIAVLLLPDEHPIHGALHGEAAIRAALEWARDPAGKEAAEEIRGAYSAYRAEQRFLASSLADDPLHYRRSSISLAELIHALHQIFDPRILESPITGIGLTGMGAVKRLAGALAYVHRAAERAVDAWSLGDIPKREDALLDAPGYGGTTHSRLAAAMLAYAREWRHVRAGVAATTAAPGVSAAQGKKALREGLDELAALFD